MWQVYESDIHLTPKQSYKYLYKYKISEYISKSKITVTTENCHKSETFLLIQKLSVFPRTLSVPVTMATVNKQ